MKYYIPLILSFLCMNLFSQSFIPHSIHQEESDYYRKNWKNQYATKIQNSKYRIQNYVPHESCQLNKTVFGYHPYWMTNTYFNYQWDLLSDLCYFSYEVDPASGDPVTTHNWLTADAVDSALANGTRAHLCVTLFSSHSIFFIDPDAQQNLIDNLIWYIQEREAHGVNLDFEAVPYSLIEDYQDFIMDFSDQFHAAMPEGLVSIAMPAVDWSGEFDVALLSDYIDLFMIMGYDYYWNGSAEAGPVSPLYSLADNYDYNLSRTISYYQSEGMPLEKMLLGQPYYARQWPTEGPVPPSSTTGNGTAYTYANIQNNVSGHYTPENRHWEENSFSNYYAFESNGWKQCFLEEPYGLGKRYDIVNRRQLAGIGIWALGYDDGYPELWQLIADKFSNSAPDIISDTIYDSGGPAWNYYNNENYHYVIGSEDADLLTLDFYGLSLESGYDSLWIFDGPDTLAPLIGSYSGIEVPPMINTTQPFACLQFKSDAGVREEGWKAVYHYVWYSNVDEYPFSMEKVFPNPFSEKINLRIKSESTKKTEIIILDIHGRKHLQETVTLFEGINEITLRGTSLKPGIYFLQLQSDDQISISKKIIKTR